MKTAYIFPGQGSQFVGMGRALAEAHPESMALFDRADQVLGRELKKMAFDGPEEELKETLNTQPALYVCGLATYEAAKAWAPAPDFLAGHSLGEYCALAAAGVFSFEDGLKLVQARAVAMSEEAKASPGAMAAILGMDDDKVAAICKSLHCTAGIIKNTIGLGDGYLIGSLDTAIIIIDVLRGDCVS